MNNRPATLLETDSRHGYAIFLMVAGSIVISFGGVVQRNIEMATSWQVIFYRSIGMFLAVSIIVFFRYRGRLMETLHGIGWLGLLGAMMISLAAMSFVISLSHTTVANTLFILGSIPFFAALFGRIFLGEKLRRQTLLTMFGGALGLGIMVAKGIQIGSGLGNALALLTAISFAVYAIIVRYKREVEMLPVLLLSSSISICTAFLVIQGVIIIPLRDILLCLLWGGVLSGFVNWMFIIASRHLVSAEVTLIMLLEFALGPVWVWWFIGEIPSSWTVIGGSIIILSVAAKAAFELIKKPRAAQTTSGSV